MSSISTNSTSVPHAGCGASPSLPAPNGSATGSGFSIPTGTAAIPQERFAHSAAGGVIIGKDGAPAGRIPAGSFVDVKSGTVYGADGKAITLPEGATADFFDLPDLAAMAAATTSTEAGGSAPMKTAVDGQWGPGGVTPIKSEDCGMDHGPATKAGGDTTTTGATTTGATTTSSNPMVDELNKLIETLQKQVSTLTGTTAAATTTAGGATAVAGASSLGSSASLNSALTDLVAAIRELGESIRTSPVLGGGPGGKPPTGEQRPPVVVPPPVTELPPSSGSGSDSSNDTTAPTSGSSSS